MKLAMPVPSLYSLPEGERAKPSLREFHVKNMSRLFTFLSSFPSGFSPNRRQRRAETRSAFGSGSPGMGYLKFCRSGWIAANILTKKSLDGKGARIRVI
ncbi:MAG: hypothetical protein HZC43_00845 [Nitrosomonadales bacterium]|nr:hypothetical protein [Nitrosomonadales bacterium]